MLLCSSTKTLEPHLVYLNLGVGEQAVPNMVMNYTLFTHMSFVLISLGIIETIINTVNHLLFISFIYFNFF